MKQTKLIITQIHDEFDLPYMRISDGSQSSILFHSTIQLYM